MNELLKKHPWVNAMISLLIVLIGVWFTHYLANANSLDEKLNNDIELLKKQKADKIQVEKDLNGLKEYMINDSRIKYESTMIILKDIQKKQNILLEKAK